MVVDIQGGGRAIAVIARRNRAGRLEMVPAEGSYRGAETLCETAAREVAEETGIEARVLIKLGTIDYWFATGDRRVHKFVHHYLLEAVGLFDDRQRPDHEAVDVAWLPLEHAHRHLTFPNEAAHRPEAWQRLAGDE